MKPFVVDVVTDDAKNVVRTRRIETDSFESAERIMESRMEYPNVSRIVISRRLGGGGLCKMKVWSRGFAS